MTELENIKTHLENCNLTITKHGITTNVKFASGLNIRAFVEACVEFFERPATEINSDIVLETTHDEKLKLLLLFSSLEKALKDNPKHVPLILVLQMLTEFMVTVLQSPCLIELAEEKISYVKASECIFARIIPREEFDTKHEECHEVILFYRRVREAGGIELDFQSVNLN